MNTLLDKAIKRDQDELKRTFGGALKGLYELDFDMYTQYVELLIWLFEQENEEALYIIECLTSFDMYDEYIAELPEGYEGTASYPRLSILCYLGRVMNNELRKQLLNEHFADINKRKAISVQWND